MNGWQPIETAPTDNTLILLFVPGSAILEIVFGRRRGPDDDDWYMDLGNQAWPIDIPVTHWMSLPDPPTTEAA